MFYHCSASCVFACLRFACFFVHSCVRLNNCLDVSLHVYLLLCMSVCLPVCLPACLRACLSVCRELLFLPACPPPLTMLVSLCLTTSFIPGLLTRLPIILPVYLSHLSIPSIPSSSCLSVMPYPRTSTGSSCIHSAGYNQRLALRTSTLMYPATYPIHNPFINLPFTRVRLHQRLNYRSIFLFTQLVINPSLGICVCHFSSRIICQSSPRLLSSQ